MSRAPALLLVALLVPLGAGAAALPPAMGAVPAPEALDALSRDLLGFGENEVVDACNTAPLETRSSAWTYEAAGGAVRATWNGTEVTPEELERRLFESGSQGWGDAWNVARQCLKPGGSCACGVEIFFTRRGAGCAVCCPDGARALCHCDQVYHYSVCGCVRS